MDLWEQIMHMYMYMHVQCKIHVHAYIGLVWVFTCLVCLGCLSLLPTSYMYM